MTEINMLNEGDVTSAVNSLTTTIGKLTNFGDELAAAIEALLKACGDALCHNGFAVAECERCEGKWLIETNVRPELLEGNCQDCSSDSETPLTFRAPTETELLLSPDKKLSKWLADIEP